MGLSMIPYLNPKDRVQLKEVIIYIKRGVERGGDSKKERGTREGQGREGPKRPDKVRNSGEMIKKAGTQILTKAS